MGCNRKITILLVLAGCLCVTAVVIGLVVGLTRESVKIKPGTHVTVELAPNVSVRGITVESERGNIIHEFYNIPYAVAPVGNLRFQPPVLCTGDECWYGEYNSTGDDMIMCIQATDGSGTEDCLVLTVRSPHLSAKLPVIVWIHGGGLQAGWNGGQGYSFNKDTTDILNAVTVNINYRLGFLGFSAFSEVLGDDPGKLNVNNGLRDQITALQWIRQNIAGFGGDPDSVTLIGESGGGTSVLALIASPLANNLFHNAIALSPAPEFRFDYQEGKVIQGFVPKALGCTQDNIKSRQQCLVNMPARNFSAFGIPQIAYPSGYFDFPKRWPDSYQSEYEGIIFTDPTVFPNSLRNLNKAAFVPSRKVKVIVSNTAAENAAISRFYGSPLFQFPNEAILNDTLTQLFKNITDNPDMVETTYKLYPDMGPQLIWDMLTTDMRSTCPTNDVAKAMSLSEHHDIYRLYISTYVLGDTTLPAYQGWDTGVLFGPENSPNATPGDVRLQKELVGILRQLANKGTVDWGMFPTNTMVLGNGDPIAVSRTEMPQAEQCEKLAELDLVKYGWQNR